MEEYLSDFNYFVILGIASDGINVIVTHFIITKNWRQQDDSNPQ